MKASRDISGVTLFELMLAVAVLSVLVSIVIGVGNYTLKQARIELAESTTSILVTALEQYHDFADMFPPECNDLTKLENELGGTFIGPGIYNDEFSSSEVLYYYLHRIPESRKIIGAIGNQQITNLDENESDVEDNRKLEFETTDGDIIALIRFIDPWGKSIRYEYNTGDNFPKIKSAGPDSFFDSDDDIVSKGR